MPAAAGVLQLVGLGVGAATAYQQGQDQKAIARNQSILDEAQADQALKSGVIAQNQYRRQVTQLLGRQRSIIAGNNLQNAGSPLALQEDTAAIGEADIANIRNQAALDAYGFKVGASESNRRGTNYDRAGTSAAFSDLASLAGKGYSMYKNSRPILGGSKLAYGSGYG